jgi:hypothetical protein
MDVRAEQWRTLDETVTNIERNETATDIEGNEMEQNNNCAYNGVTRDPHLWVLQLWCVNY